MHSTSPSHRPAVLHFSVTRNMACADIQTFIYFPVEVSFGFGNFVFPDNCFCRKWKVGNLEMVYRSWSKILYKMTLLHFTCYASRETVIYFNYCGRLSTSSDIVKYHSFRVQFAFSLTVRNFHNPICPVNSLWIISSIHENEINGISICLCCQRDKRRVKVSLFYRYIA